MRKLAAYPRQNQVARSLTKLGKLERTSFLQEYFRDESLRRRILIGLNRGNSPGGRRLKRSLKTSALCHNVCPRFASVPMNFLLVCHLFHCTMDKFSQAFQGKAPDPNQEGAEWLPLQQLASCRFYPQSLISSLIELEQGTSSSVPLYVGDIN